MIVIVCGTNGAGKTHLARRILALLPEQPNRILEIQREGKKKSTRIGYVWRNLTVVGSYDDPGCGGCDKYSWKGASDDMERFVVDASEDGQNVMLEGLIVATWGRERLGRLMPYGLTIIHLNTPIDECIASVNERRKQRAASEGTEYTPVKEDNIRSKFSSLLGQQKARRAMGISVLELDRESAFNQVKQLLGL